MRRIVDGIHVGSRLSMMSRISPRSCRSGTVELVMVLTGYARDLHGGYSIHVARGQNAGTSGGGSLCRVLHIGNCNRVTLVRFTITETFGKRIAGDLQLRDAVILISGDRGESRLREGKRFEILRARIRGRTRWRGCHYYVASRLVSMHRIQDYL